MVYSHEKINQLTGGWYIVYGDGEVITESVMSWNEVPRKKDIKIMGLKRHNRHYELENKLFGPPGEHHMRELAINNGTGVGVTKQSLIGWFLSYYTPTAKVFFRVDAVTGKFWEEEVPY
jgi:hypothetical protein